MPQRVALRTTNAYNWRDINAIRDGFRGRKRAARGQEAGRLGKSLKMAVNGGDGALKRVF
jgi:hypothetical protein